MKSLLTVILLFSFSFIFALAGDLHVNSFKVINVTNTHIDVEFNLPDFHVENTAENGIQFQKIATDHCDYSIKTGYPELPIFSTMIAVPYHGQIDTEIISSEHRDILNIVPYPVQSKLENGEAPKSFSMNNEFYSGRYSYPERTLQTSDPQIIRDFRVIDLTIQPFTYSSSDKKITVNQKIIVRLNIRNEPGMNEMEPPTNYSRSFEPLYRSLISNYDQFRDVSLPYSPERILMIRPNSTDQTFLNKFNDLVLWKKQKGYNVTTATATETGSTTTSIKTYIQNAYNDPQRRPDYVILIGDTSGNFAIPNWSYSWDYYNGETDYPYTHLAGNDLLGDVFIGRISIESTNDFLNLVAKGFTYEKVIPTQQATWLNRVLLAGDTSSSGISTVYTNKFIKEVSLTHNPNYTYTEIYSGSFPNQINAGLNQGVGFWNYRGYLGMSGWSPSSSIVNGIKIPHAVIITCGTGSYAGTSTTESLIRLGTANNPAGSITAIGMSTIGTHTALNNCLAGSIFEGLFTYDMHTMGQALLYAKIYLNSIYGVSDPTLAAAFAHICNLMGDPTVEAFKGIPSTFSVTYPTTIPSGTAMFEISVNDNISHSISNAHVTLSSGSEVVFNGMTDSSGKVYASIPTSISGQLIVTVSMQDYYPFLSTIDINPSGALVYDSQTIDDDNTGNSSGNSNNQANGGETIEYFVNVKNTSSSVMDNISGILSSQDPFVQISTTTAEYNTIQAGAIVPNISPFLLYINNNCPDHYVIHFNLSLSSGIALPVLLEVRNADMDISTVVVNDNANQILDPGETSLLNVSLINNGTMPLTNLSGILHSGSGLVVVQDSTAFYGNVNPGDTIIPTTDTFIIHGQLQLIRGMKIPFTIDLFNDAGYTETELFFINIGQVSVTDPFGPDNYGYLIYDTGDTGYPDVPSYDWVGISPTESGSGTLLAFNDTGSDYDEGDNVGSVTILPVTLPFAFSFYGVNYQSMSVCSNGFITFTNSQNGDFRNWHLPGALGPNAMVAAFWDDLILLTGAGVYRYYDSVQHRFIIEWYQTKNGYDRTSEETFEVILYDPAYYPTSNGDGQIKIQYKVFNNVDTGGGGSPRQGDYCTIGIKDHTGLVGLEYSFNNQYPAAAAPLSNNNALLITGIPIVQEAPHILLGELVLQDQNMNQIAEPGETVDFGIRLSNMGNTIATNVHASISSVDEYVTILNSSSLYDPIAGQNSGINKTYFRILISPACPDHHIITLTVFITAQGYSWQRYASIQVTKPQLSFGNTYINDINGNNNGMADPGESFKIIMNISNPGTVDDKDATITVSTTDQSLIISNPTIQIGRIPAGQTKQAVVNMSLAQNAVIGNFVTIHYQLSGDNANPINGVYSLGIHTTGVYNDFEATNGGFISQSGWMWGTSNQTSGHSGRNMWGTSLNAEYPANANFILTTPLLMIGSNAQLSFWHKYGCESTYDGGNVSISTDGGTTYNLLTPDGGYPALSVSSLQEPCFSGTLSSWVLVNFDLSQYGNQQIKIRWHFCSDSMVNGIGWFIDDVSISGFTNPTGIIQGNLQFAEENPQYTHALIHANNIAVQPDTTGYYQIFLQNGTYNISVDMPSYQTLSSQAVILNATNQTQIVNFNMNYLPPVPHLWYQVSNHHLTMSWDDLEPSANQFQHFSILRRIDADRYLLIGQTTSTNYSEDLTSEGEYSYFVTVDYLQGTSIPSDSITFQSDATGNSDQNVIPAKTVLFANYPNPFNPETHISFALSHDSRVKLEIFNIRGQLVKTLTDEPYTAGTYSVNWNGTDKNNHSVASGMYFYRLSLPGYSSTRKALLLK